MLVTGWPGLLALVGLIRTAVEPMKVNNTVKKVMVVGYSLVATQVFNFNVAGLLGLQLSPLGVVGMAIVNTTLLSLATFIGHDGLDQLAGKA